MNAHPQAGAALCARCGTRASERAIIARAGDAPTVDRFLSPFLSVSADDASLMRLKCSFARHLARSINTPRETHLRGRDSPRQENGRVCVASRLPVSVQDRFAQWHIELTIEACTKGAIECRMLDIISRALAIIVISAFIYLAY